MLGRLTYAHELCARREKRKELFEGGRGTGMGEELVKVGRTGKNQRRKESGELGSAVGKCSLGSNFFGFQR